MVWQVRVCMVDTGIDYTHPDLIQNMWINQVEAHGPGATAANGYKNGIDDDGNGAPISSQITGLECMQGLAGLCKPGPHIKDHEMQAQPPAEYLRTSLQLSRRRASCFGQKQAVSGMQAGSLGTSRIRMTMKCFRPGNQYETHCFGIWSRQCSIQGCHSQTGLVDGRKDRDAEDSFEK